MASETLTWQQTEIQDDIDYPGLPRIPGDFSPARSLRAASCGPVARAVGEFAQESRQHAELSR